MNHSGLVNHVKEMTLTDLAVFQGAVDDIIRVRRRALLNDLVRSKGIVGLMVPVRKGRGRNSRIVRHDKLNAEVLEYDKGKLKVHVIRPAKHFGKEIEVSEELVYGELVIQEEA